MNKYQDTAIEEDASIYIIERLCILTWIFRILPALVIKKNTNKAIKCLIFNSHPITYLFARISGRLTGVSVEFFKYDILDVRTKEGISARLLVVYREMASVQEKIAREPTFSNFVESNRKEGRSDLYLRKKLLEYDPVGIDSLNSIGNLLILVLVAQWKAGKLREDGNCVFFVNRRPWHKIIESYADRRGIQLMPLSVVNLSKSAIMKSFKKTITGRLILQLRDYRADKRCNRESHDISTTSILSPMIGTEYFSYFKIDKPECYSELFFWQESEIPASSIMLLYKSSIGEVTKKLNKKLKECGIVSFGYSANNFFGWLGNSGMSRYKPSKNKREDKSSRESRWFDRTYKEYQRKKNQWKNIFSEKNIRVFTHWYKYDGEHIAMTDALRELGGIMTIYQRSYEELPSPRASLSVDIQFSFSRLTSDVEYKNGSSILYQVITGYLGDHRFALLRNDADKIRSRLKKNGARILCAFFDENTAHDPRWFAGHDFTRENYVFLLEKLLKNKWMGLVLKPKAPRTLRQRLGKTTELLNNAIKTGRCHLLEEGRVQGSYPPAVAALASDLAIQEFMSSGTAGMESALCGTPTLMLDREGWPLSKFYSLGRGKVVFNDLESIWSAIDDCHLTNKANSGLGDWSAMIDEIDPFRDGHSARRMGDYLHWLINGLQEGKDRNSVMTEAAEKYANRWGEDKVVCGIGE